MALFDQVIKNHPAFMEGLKHDFLDDQREKALRKFELKGFPNKKVEDYKYTNLTKIVRKEYNMFPKEGHHLTREQIDQLHLGEENFDFIVFINGKLQMDLSKISIKNAEFLSFEEALSQEEHRKSIEEYINKAVLEKNVFAQLNLAYFKFGFFLHLPKNVAVEKPIHVLYLSQNQEEDTFYNSRNLLIVDENSSVEVIESHYNFDKHYVLTNNVTELFVCANAKADWHKLENDKENSYLIDNTFVKQEKDSTATVNSFSFGGELVRNNLDFVHYGENINSFTNGITMINDEQLVDNHITVYHNFPHCQSYQNYKGIYDGKAHGVFNGKVNVDRLAQKTDAYQQNNNVLLSKTAKVDSKPHLEIYADDVRCTHGCTVGQLDENAMFYLRARGISEKEAKAMLLFGFASDAMANIDIEPLRLRVSELLAEKLEVEMEF